MTLVNVGTILSSSWSWRGITILSSHFPLLLLKSPRVRLASSTFFPRSLSWASRFLLDFFSRSSRPVKPHQWQHEHQQSRHNVLLVLFNLALHFCSAGQSVQSSQQLASWCFFLRHKGKLLLNVSFLKSFLKSLLTSASLFLLELNLSGGSTTGLMQSLPRL